MNETTATTTTAQGANTNPPDYQNDTCPVCGGPVASGSIYSQLDRLCAQGHQWQWIQRWNGWYKITVKG